MLTKAQVRTMIRALIPDSEKQVWSDSTLDVLTQLTADELYASLIDTAMWFSSQLDTIAYSSLTSPGYIDLTTSGPLSKRFYRVQKATSNNQEYSPGDVKDSVVYQGVQVSAQRFTYSVFGSQLWMFPLQLTCPVELRYSFLPPAYTLLSDSAAVAWIEGFEGALIHEVVARASMNDAITNKNHAIHLAAFDRLRSRIAREYIGPAQQQGPDDSLSWGGT